MASDGVLYAVDPYSKHYVTLVVKCINFFHLWRAAKRDIQLFLKNRCDHFYVSKKLRQFRLHFFYAHLDEIFTSDIYGPQFFRC